MQNSKLAAAICDAQSKAAKSKSGEPELLAPTGICFLGKPTGKMMSGQRGGRATRGNHEDDLQRDDRGAGHARQKSNKDLDKELEKTLEDSFPSSDPPAISQPTGTEPAGDPKTKP